MSGSKLAGESPLRDPTATLDKSEGWLYLWNLEAYEVTERSEIWKELRNLVGSTITAEMKQERLHKRRNYRKIKSVCPSKYFYFDTICFPASCEVFRGLGNAKLKDLWNWLAWNRTWLQKECLSHFHHVSIIFTDIKNNFSH